MLGFVIDRPQDVVSYCGDLNAARWVSWRVVKEDYGPAKRFGGNFITDRSLPRSYAVIRHSDYTGSGYDRGHIVRSLERTRNDEDNKSTFLLTNIIPQVPSLNRDVWLQLELYCEMLAKERDKQLFIVSGGRYSADPKRLKGKIAVPDSCWKVVLVLDKGKTVVDVNTEIIAVMMPNNATVGNSVWKDYLTTTRAIERSTGFDFFAKVEQRVQDVIENRKYLHSTIASDTQTPAEHTGGEADGVAKHDYGFENWRIWGVVLLAFLLFYFAIKKKTKRKKKRTKRRKNVRKKRR
jgi:endonuclease G